MDKQWFAIHTYSGYENRVKQTIEHRAQLEGLREKVGQVLVPAKKFVEIKGGKKYDVMKNIMPGYVFVQAEPDEEVFAMVQKIQGVSAFLGDAGKPTALAQTEVDSLIGTIEERPDRPRTVITHRVNDQVKVIEG